MGRMQIAVHQGHGQRFDAIAPKLIQASKESVFLQFPIYFTIGEDALIDLEHCAVQGREARASRKDLKDPTPTLVANPKQIGEATGDDQRRPRPLTGEQRIGRNRRTHPQGVEMSPWIEFLKKVQGRLRTTVYSQHFAMMARSARTRGDQIGKRPASIHSDVPTTTHRNNPL
jgi:hypothetical protein